MTDLEIALELAAVMVVQGEVLERGGKRGMRYAGLMFGASAIAWLTALPILERAAEEAAAGRASYASLLAAIRDALGQTGGA